MPERLTSLMVKAGFRPILPEGFGNLCCGQAFESKGLAEAADVKTAELAAALIYLAMAALVLHISREVIHHGSEVCVLLDLHRSSRGGTEWRNP